MLLDIFTTIFRADTGGLDQGLDDSERAADRLADRLIDTDKGAAAAGKSFAGFAAGAIGALTAALSVGTIIANAVETAGNIKVLSQTAESLDVAIEDLDAFGRAAELAGGDAQGARDSLTDMAEKIGEAFSDTESGAAKAFQKLGISVKDADGKAKDAISGFLDLSKAVEGLDKSEAIFKIKELGITDNKSVELILKGRKELERMMAVQKEQGVVTKENALVAARFNDAMTSLKMTADRVGLGISTSVLPALTKIVEWAKTAADWLATHKNLVIGFFGAIAAVVMAVYLPAMISAAVATLAATWPIIAIVALVGALAAAFALAYDDVMAFVAGNDSFIGQIFEKFPKVKELVFMVVDAFKFMGQVVLQVWDTLLIGFKQMLDFVMTGIKQIASGVSTVAKFFGIGSDDEDGSADAARAGAAAGKAALTDAGNSPLNATTSASISNTVASSKAETNVQIGEVNVQTQATDAAGISKDISGGLNTQLKQMDSEFSTGRER